MLIYVGITESSFEHALGSMPSSLCERMMNRWKLAPFTDVTCLDCRRQLSAMFEQVTGVSRAEALTDRPVEIPEPDRFSTLSDAARRCALLELD